MPDPARKYTQITKAVYERPWAITRPMLAVIEEIVRLRGAGTPLTDDEIDQRVTTAQVGPRRGADRAQGVAVIPIYGVIAPKANIFSEMSGATTVEGLLRDFRSALADPDVGAIVFDVDSPGGSVEGITEAATEIRAARGQKPMSAVSNTLMASAAYWLASAADEIVASPSAEVGSIGIIGVHVDVSKQDEMVGEAYTFITAGEGKANGNEHEPLSDEARDEIQEAVDDYYALFTADVVAGRGVPKATVTADWKARMFTAKKAKAAGLVERVDTLDATVRRLAVKANRASPGAIAGITTHESLVALALERDYSERLALASALVEDVAESTQTRLALRAEEGRGLSDANWDALSALAGAAGSLPTKPATETAGDPDPTPPQADGDWRGRARLDVLEAATRGNYPLPPIEVHPS